MTAVEEIQAAIVKLTTLKAESIQGPWWAWHPEGQRYNSAVQAPGDDLYNAETPVEGERADVDLIVTLHRTIDAQLGILQETATQLIDAYGGAQLGPEFYRTELALARAINGARS